MDRPDRDTIYRYYETCVRYYGALHTLMRKWIDYERLAYAQYLTHLPDGYEAKIPATAAEAVRTLVDHVLLGEQPELTVLLASGQKGSKKEQEQIEFLQGWLDGAQAQVDQSKIEAPLRDAISQTANPGMGTITYGLNWDKWADDPVKREGETPAEFRQREKDFRRENLTAWPFELRSVPPLNIYFDPVEDPPRYVIEVQRKKLLDYEDYAEALAGSQPSNGATLRGVKGQAWEGMTIEVEEITFVSKEWYACYINRIPTLNSADHSADDEGVAPNPDGIIWYKRAIAGLGKNDYDNRPEYKIRGLLADGIDTLDMEAEAINQINYNRGAYALGGQQVSHPGGAEAGKAALRANPITIGGETFTDDQIKIQPLQLPQMAPSVGQSLELLQGLTDLAFGASTLRGIGTAGDPAAKYRTMLSEARLKFAATTQSCQQMWAAVWSDILAMIKGNPEAFKRGVSVYGSMKGKGTFMTLYPQDIPETIIKCRFSPLTAEEKGFRMQQGLELNPPGDPAQWRIPEAMFLKDYAGIKDPEGTIRELAKDRMRRAVMDYMSQVAVKMAEAQLQQTHPQLFAPAAPSAPADATGGQPQPVQPQGVTVAGPQGQTPPGEQPVAPGLQQQNLNQMQQYAGAAPGSNNGHGY